jgi:hypothetical protein
MPEVYSHDIVFFFGAGASAPFGIPTMQQFVSYFEKELEYDGDATINWTDDERSRVYGEKWLYMEIRETLKKNLGRPVDLEAVFTVVDGLLNYSPERLGLLSLYAATDFKKHLTDKSQQDACRSLREKFQCFVRDKCIIPEESFSKIGAVYRDFFNRFALELPGANTFRQSHGYSWSDRWTMFTTNYDTCLEYYWSFSNCMAQSTG